MEPFGVIASSVALAQVIGKIAKFANKYRQAQ